MYDNSLYLNWNARTFTAAFVISNTVDFSQPKSEKISFIVAKMQQLQTW